MSVDLLIKPDAVLLCQEAQSKRQVLQVLAGHAASLTGRNNSDILDCLLTREKLGSTGVGRGVAIPHAKLKDLSEIIGVFARLQQPVNFESLDEQPVDLVFLLLVPENSGSEHLIALARIARRLRDSNVVEMIRTTDSREQICSCINGNGAAELANQTAQEASPQIYADS